MPTEPPRVLGVCECEPTLLDGVTTADSPEEQAIACVELHIAGMAPWVLSLLRQVRRDERTLRNQALAQLWRNRYPWQRLFSADRPKEQSRLDYVFDTSRLYIRLRYVLGRLLSMKAKP